MILFFSNHHDDLNLSIHCDRKFEPSCENLIISNAFTIHIMRILYLYYTHGTHFEYYMYSYYRMYVYIVYTYTTIYIYYYIYLLSAKANSTFFILNSYYLPSRLKHAWYSLLSSVDWTKNFFKRVNHLLKTKNLLIVSLTSSNNQYRSITIFFCFL